jgi:tetratricopeptide (TPR) repeat protein
MTLDGSESQHWPESAGVVVLESQPGDLSDAAVARWLVERRANGGRGWQLQCSPQHGGVWAGLSDLIASIVPAVRDRSPELLSRHGRELCMVVPMLRPELGFPESLTDTVDAEEKTRNYAADRAYRCLHGLIELVSECHQITGGEPWSIACQSYDEANALVRRFFAELWRRRGPALDLRLLVVVGHGRGDAVADEFQPSPMVATLPLTRTARGPEVESPETMSRLALELERQRVDGTLPDEQLPRLIDAWRRSSAPERALRWQLSAMSLYNHLGLYEASLPYAADVEAGLDRLRKEDISLYTTAVNVLYYCRVPLGHVEAAQRIVESALEHVADSIELARLHYLAAMLYARFLKPNDQDRAEQHLQRALVILAASATISDSEREFLTVFMMNGLALVRLRQGRLPDALALCSEGIIRLNEHLGPERHRLHRSVLLFNIAQVHAQIGPHEEAIAYFTEAMALDPNYSEYYNDRGAVYFKMGQLEHAERDYLQAIELSSPYAEVWTNLGQCYRAMERMNDAVRAYSRATDLDPQATLALVGRAEANAALDRAELALADYDRALAIDPDQPLVLASRAVLHYDAQRLRDSVNDLNAAIKLAPELGELYQNRAIALRDLGRPDQAAQDLNTYLQLCPNADDRDDVEASLSTLLARR